MNPAQPSQPLSGRAYGLITLIGLICGVGLLFFYVYQVPRLVESSAQNQVYYLLLIPWALSCSAFLFGAMRSFARFTHKRIGSALELGGPVVLFCLVVAGGFKLVPSSAETFDLAVRARSKDSPLITSGQITLDLPGLPRASISPDGEANFKGLSARFKGSRIRILPQVEGYEKQWQSFKLTGGVVDLSLVREAPPMTLLTGSIIIPSGVRNKIKILVDGQKSEATPDQFGRFELSVSGKAGDRVRLKVYARGDLVYDDYQILPGPVMLKLHGIR